MSKQGIIYDLAKSLGFHGVGAYPEANTRLFHLDMARKGARIRQWSHWWKTDPYKRGIFAAFNVGL